MKQIDFFGNGVFRFLGNYYYCRCFISRSQRWFYGAGPEDRCGAFHGDWRCSWACFREGDQDVMEARLRRRLWAARRRARQAKRARCTIVT